MEIYIFVRSLLGWMALVALLWPLNAAMLYAAYRIRDARISEEDENYMEPDELRTRSLIGAGVVALLTAVFLFADLVFATWLDMPAGPVHFAVLLGYVPAAAYVLMLFFAENDFFQSMSLLTLYIALPLFVLWPLGALLGATNFPPMSWITSLLKVVTA